MDVQPISTLDTYLTTIVNLQSQRPIRSPNGVWDVAVWVDLSTLSPEQQIDGQRIEAMARQAGMIVCRSADELVQTNAQTLFVVGHNTGSNQPGVLRDLCSLGERLEGRWIILNLCGLDEYRVEVFDLRLATLAAAVSAHHDFVPTTDIVHIFKEFIALGEREGEVLPEIAMSLVIKHLSEPADSPQSKS